MSELPLHQFYVFPRLPAVLLAVLWLAPGLWAQGTLADYERAREFQTKARNLAAKMPNLSGAITWIGDSNHFWYPLQTKGGTEYMLVDATRGEKKLAFDHDKLAAAVSAITGQKYTGLTLPFLVGRSATTSPLQFFDAERSLQFGAGGFLYACTLVDYTCNKRGPLSQFDTQEPAAVRSPEAGGDPVDGLEYEPPAPQQDGGTTRRRTSQTQIPCAFRPHSPALEPRPSRARLGVGAQFGGQLPPTPSEVCASFDGKWEAFIQNYNVFLKPSANKAPAVPLSSDGSEGNAYTLRSIAWSPDSRKVVAYHVRPGYDREVHYIESSPGDQRQPKHTTISYRKPGDALDVAYPALFDVETRQEIEIDHALFPNPYNITPPVWWKDSRGFTFEYNQRGHQVYRVIEVDARTGKTRPLISEECKTFFYYNPLGPGISAGRRYRHDVKDGKEIIWASERDGWEHLYLYDGTTGHVKNEITKGPWLVRSVDFVDDDKRQIWFGAGSMNPGQDPYFVQYYRINFDGTELTRLTEADGTHAVTFSPDHVYYVDSWQRVDQPAATQLRRSADQKVVLDLGQGDDSELRAAGVKYPEVFVAKGRDGKTDIWGVIFRPSNFDAARKYPVIENIYAGPHGSFVPKTFSAGSDMQALADLGFIVVQIDGMGTSNRSKAFHDVAWKNLGDAGFPDRIRWHQAVARKYPHYDISRVGIYGTSAGGQSAMGALLFHSDFYKVAVTNSGCHDNRMDKIWWNEQWMGWPVGPQYSASSNVDNAYRLQGHVLIIVGEMDSNVDPASSLQLVNALVKAHKHFDMLYIPGQNHGVPVLASEHYRDDYFVRQLLGVEPPDWNHVSFTDTKALDCTQEGSLKSRQGETRTSLEIENLAASERDVYWLDFEGNRVLYQSMAPGANYRVDTFPEHPWVITNAAGRCLGIYLAKPEGSAITIRK